MLRVRRHPPVLPECLLPPRPDLGNPVHSLERGGDEFSVVSNGNVSSLLELERGVLDEGDQLRSKKGIEGSWVVPISGTNSRDSTSQPDAELAQAQSNLPHRLCSNAPLPSTTRNRRVGTHHDHLLAVRPSEGLCPPDLSRVPLHLEVFVALARTEPEAFCVVSDKHCPVAGVHVDRAEVALFDSHGCELFLGLVGVVERLVITTIAVLDEKDGQRSPGRT